MISFQISLYPVCVSRTTASCIDIKGSWQCSLDGIKKNFFKESKNAIKVPEEHVGCSLCLVCGCRPGVSRQDPGGSLLFECWISCSSIFFLVPSLVFARASSPQRLCPHFRRYLVLSVSEPFMLLWYKSDCFLAFPISGLYKRRSSLPAFPAYLVLACNSLVL